jgi:Holliday junction resolvase RusA-like endonuclease
MSQKVELVLEGTIPSKKNSRNNLGNGVSLPSKEFMQWQKDAIPIVRQQTRHRFFGILKIEIILYFGTLGRADTDNKVTSILDMLVQAMVLKDDYWESVADTHYQAAYRPGKSGAFIRITELPKDFFGEEYLVAAAKRDKRKRLP